MCPRCGTTLEVIREGQWLCPSCFYTRTVTIVTPEKEEK